MDNTSGPGPYRFTTQTNLHATPADGDFIYHPVTFLPPAATGGLSAYSLHEKSAKGPFHYEDYMDFLSTAELAIPVYQLMLLLLISTLSLLAGRTKLALIVNYLFTMYWGFVFNRNILLGHEFEYWYLIYFGFGSSIAILASVGFLIHEK